MSNTQSTDSSVSELDRVQFESWPESNRMAFTVFQVNNNILYYEL